MKRTSFIFLVFVLFIVVTNAQIINVPGDQPSIQAGINAATNGDTVLVADSSYYENINFKGKAITVASHFLVDRDTSHIFKTIIDGSQPVDTSKASVVTFRSGEDTTSVLIGFTITRGQGTYDLYEYPMGSGGGILIHGSGGKICHNIIENNVMGTSTDPWTEQLFYSGGGICANVFNNHTLIVRKNIIRNNRCIGEMGNGAGAYLTGGRIIFDNNTVRDNILDMKSNPIGAGLSWKYIDYEGYIDEYIIRNNFIIGNVGYSQVKNGKGGGVSLTFGNFNKAEFYNNIIAENYTEGVGGGMFFNNVRAIVYSNSIVNNEATEQGHSLSIYIEWQNELVLYNNIIWSSVDNEKSDIDLWGSMSIQYNLLKESLQQDDTVFTTGNIYNVPAFSGSSYELAEFSSAIGRGADSVLSRGTWYYTPKKDILGNDRPNPIDPYIDLGAIESPYAWTTASIGEALENIEVHSISVYPNPASTELFIQTAGCSIGIVDITSLNGLIIQSLLVEEPTYHLDFSSFKRGIYFITIRSSNYVRTEKIIKL